MPQNLSSLPSRAEYETDDNLTEDMFRIGFHIVGSEPFKGRPLPNIEKTLIAASIEGAVGRDFRVLAVLTTWLGMHHKHVNFRCLQDLLKPLFAEIPNDDLSLYWSAIGFWIGQKDRRFAAFKKCYSGPRREFGNRNSQVIIDEHGQDPRFAESPLKIVVGGIRHRLRDVMPAVDIAYMHPIFANRIRMGPTYRADIFMFLEMGLTDIKEIVEKTNSSPSLVHRTKKDWQILREAAKMHENFAARTSSPSAPAQSPGLSP